jgi:hypothetical protein
MDVRESKSIDYDSKQSQWRGNKRQRASIHYYCLQLQYSYCCDGGGEGGLEEHLSP